MSEAQPVVPAGDITDNDKLMAALGYIIPVIVPLIILLVETMKVRPYQRYHALQSLGLSVAELVYSVILCILLTICGTLAAAATLGIGGILTACLSVLYLVPFIPNIYYTYLAYAKPAYFEIPVVGPFMKQQGWLTA